MSSKRKKYGEEKVKIEAKYMEDFLICQENDRVSQHFAEKILSTVDGLFAEMGREGIAQRRGSRVTAELWFSAMGAGRRMQDSSSRCSSPPPQAPPDRSTLKFAQGIRGNPASGSGIELPDSPCG